MASRTPVRPALVICCKDYRYIQPIQRFVKQRLGIQWYNLKATAGGSRALLDSPSVVQKWILRDIELVYRLHGVRRVVIIHHADCAAYGGSAKLGKPAQERRFHRAQVKRTGRLLRKNFAGLKVSGFLASGYPAAIRVTPLN